MSEWLNRDREVLVEAIRTDVATHVAALTRLEHDFYGYALTFGLESNLMAPCAATNCLEDFEPYRGEPDSDYYFYAVNEWAHWWPSSPEFATSRRITGLLQGEFERLHLELADPNSFIYDRWQTENQMRHQQAVLKALVGLRADEVLPSGCFLTVWISGSHWDSGLSVVEESVKRLNTPDHVSRYLGVFAE